MAKIPFSIDYRPQIESGEYKVETRDGKHVRILCYDANNIVPIVALVTFNDGSEGACHYYSNGAMYCEETPLDLFIVTQEEELSPLEKELVDILKCLSGRPSEQTYEDYAKEQTAQLLSLAREQFIKDGYVIEKKAFHDAVKKVDPEVMKEVFENIDNTERTEFEGRLVKFYNDSNSLTCDKDGVFNRHERDELLHNTASELLSLARKEFAKEYKGGSEANEKTISAYCSGYEAGKAKALDDLDGTGKVHCKSYDKGYDCGKKEALKDLPRWKKIGQGNNYWPETEFCINGRYLEMNDTWNDLYEISLKNLEKLPKEDEK